MHGTIFDEYGNRLSGVTVTGKAIDTDTWWRKGLEWRNGSDTLVTTSQVGSYALNGLSPGTTVMVTVSKPGLTTRQQTIVGTSSFAGDPTANLLDFGRPTSDPDKVFALSDKPEVISVTPAAEATGVSPSTSFVLTFSEPVATREVENAFAVYVAGNAGQSYPIATGLMLPVAFNMLEDTGKNPPSQVIANPGEPVLTINNCTATWSDDKRTVTFTPRTGVKLATSRDPAQVPRYAVTFRGPIQDADGVARDSNWFRVSPDRLGQVGCWFTVAPEPAP